jgi:hypothetical protein
VEWLRVGGRGLGHEYARLLYKLYKLDGSNQ